MREAQRSPSAQAPDSNVAGSGRPAGVGKQSLVETVGASAGNAAPGPVQHDRGAPCVGVGKQTLIERSFGSPGTPYPARSPSAAHRDEQAIAPVAAGPSPAPAAGAVATAASRDRPSAAAYFVMHERHFFDAIRARLASSSIPAPHARLAWVGSGQGIVSAFEPALIDAGGGNWTAYQIAELLHPVDPWHLIDQYREVDEGTPGELEPRGSPVWNPIAGTAFAVELAGQLRQSFPRIGLRYVAQADDYAGDVSPAMLVTSHPMDRVVARLLCDPSVVRFVHRHDKRQGTRRKPEDTDARAAFKNGIRLATFEWQGAHDPKLWNYVRVTDPLDATREEVSAALYQRDDGENHTEYAYGLTGASPFFRLPPKWARAFKAATEHAPPESAAEGAEVDGALQLADSTLGDEAAVAQAAAASQHDKHDARHSPDASRLTRTLAQSTGQLKLVGDRLGDWKLYDRVGPALRWIAKHQDVLAAAPPETLQRWAPIVEGQRALLFEATGEILDVLDTASKSPAAPGSLEAKPLHDVLEAFAVAMGESQLIETASQQLAAAKRLKAALPLRLLDLSMRANRTATQDLAAPPADSQPGEPDRAKQAQLTQGTLEAGAIELRAKQLSGAPISPAEIEASAVAAAEHGLRSRVATLETKVQRLKLEAWDANEGGVAKLANIFDGDLHELPGKLIEVQEAARLIVVAMNQRTMTATTAVDRPEDPAVYEAGVVTARRHSVATAERELAELATRADLHRLCQKALDTIRDARLHTHRRGRQAAAER